MKTNNDQLSLYNRMPRMSNTSNTMEHLNKEVKWSFVFGLGTSEMFMCVLAYLLSPVQLFATPWTVAWLDPLSMGFSRKEYCSGLPFPSPGSEIWRRHFLLIAWKSKKKKNHDLDHSIISKTNLEKNKARDVIFIFHKNNHDRPMYYSSSFNFNILLRNSR